MRSEVMVNKRNSYSSTSLLFSDIQRGEWFTFGSKEYVFIKINFCTAVYAHSLEEPSLSVDTPVTRVRVNASWEEL